MARVAWMVAASLLLAGCTGLPPEADPTDGPPDDPPELVNGDAPDEGGDADGQAAAPRWWVTDTEGAERSHQTVEGNVTLLFFMATWCSSCRSKAPHVRDIQMDYAQRGLAVLSIGTDPNEGDAKLEKWKADLDQPWPHAVDRNGTVVGAFDVSSQSTIVVIDAAGLIVANLGYSQGGPALADVRQAVDRAYEAGDP